MNEELTNEVLEAIVDCDCSACIECPAQSVCAAGTRQVLAAALLEEKAKPKVWDGAPERANIVDVYWSDKMGAELGNNRYTRELPKTRTREIAENIVHGINGKTRGETKDIEYVEGVLKRYAKELEGKE